MNNVRAFTDKQYIRMHGSDIIPVYKKDNVSYKDIIENMPEKIENDIIETNITVGGGGDSEDENSFADDFSVGFA